MSQKKNSNSYTLSVESSVEGIRKQLEKRIKKLRSQVKSQQKKNEDYRLSAKEIGEKKLRSYTESREQLLSTLNSVREQVIAASANKSFPNEIISELIQMLDGAYLQNGVDPHFPEYFSFSPPRPWGKKIDKSSSKTSDQEKAFFEEMFAKGGIGEEMFGEEEDEDDDLFSEAMKSQRKKFEEEAKLWRGEERGRPKGESATELRKLFISLARRVHPDTISDPNKRRAADEFMKRVNEAYRRGDVHQMLELQSDLENEVFITTTSTNFGGDIFSIELQKQVDLLTNQLAELKADLKKLKKTDLGKSLSSEVRMQKKGFITEDYQTVMLREMEEELSELNAKLSQTLSNKITPKIFTKWFHSKTAGPSEEEAFEMFAQMANELFSSRGFR
jgi:hypothetical protein